MKAMLLAALLCAALVFSPACAVKSTTAPTYPNQLNTFDGAAYSTLTIVQASLQQAKTLAPQYPQFKPQLNQAIATYNAALAAYKIYHAAGGTGDTAALGAELATLTGQVSAVLATFGVTPQ
jgi:hypothetical protein